MNVPDESMAINGRHPRLTTQNPTGHSFFSCPMQFFHEPKQISSSSSPQTIIDKLPQPLPPPPSPGETVTRVLMLIPQKHHALRSVSTPSRPCAIHQDPSFNTIHGASEIINTVWFVAKKNNFNRIAHILEGLWPLLCSRL